MRPLTWGAHLAWYAALVAVLACAACVLGYTSVMIGFLVGGALGCALIIYVWIRVNRETFTGSDWSVDDLQCRRGHYLVLFGDGRATCTGCEWVGDAAEFPTHGLPVNHQQEDQE